MQSRTVSYRNTQGWIGALPVDLDGPQTLVAAFGAPEFADDPQALTELSHAFPRSVVVGCSTSGEISGAEVVDLSISAAIARFEHTRLKLATTTIAGPDDSYDAGKRVAAQLVGEGLRAVFLISSGTAVNGSSLIAGLAASLPAEVTITGGLAGDGDRFVRTWVLVDGMPVSHRACAVGLYGERLRVGHGCSGGWAAFGPERRITRSTGNVLFELDDKPALSLYKTYLGDLAAGLPGTALLFPLSVRRSADDSESLVRTIIGIDEATQSMTFAGDLPQGGIARLMRANADNLIDSAGDAAVQATRELVPGKDALVLSVSCVGRRLVLGERTEEEVETVLDGVPTSSTHVGFYSYGEISPSVPGGASELHNQTMTVTVFSEV